MNIGGDEGEAARKNSGAPGPLPELSDAHPPKKRYTHVDAGKLAHPQRGRVEGSYA